MFHWFPTSFFSIFHVICCFSSSQTSMEDNANMYSRRCLRRQLHFLPNKQRQLCVIKAHPPTIQSSNLMAINDAIMDPTQFPKKKKHQVEQEDGSLKLRQNSHQCINAHVNEIKVLRFVNKTHLNSQHLNEIYGENSQFAWNSLQVCCTIPVKFRSVIFGNLQNNTIISFL